jgi:hypothetical protein
MMVALFALSFHDYILSPCQKQSPYRSLKTNHCGMAAIKCWSLKREWNNVFEEKTTKSRVRRAAMKPKYPLNISNPESNEYTDGK